MADRSRMRGLGWAALGLGALVVFGTAAAAPSPTESRCRAEEVARRLVDAGPPHDRLGVYARAFAGTRS